MKNIYRLMLGMGLVGLTYSCTDLEENLVGELTQEVVVDGVVNQSYCADPGPSDALSGAYAAIRNAGTANHGGYFSVQNVSTDEMAVTQKGGDWYDGGIWLDVHRHTQTSSNGPITGTWDQQYNSIAEVNAALNSVSGNAGLVAQAKVLRAYLHWRLMDMYGRIKYVTESGASAQLSRSDAFYRIHDDLLAGLGITLDDVTGDLAGALASSPLGTADTKYRVNQYAALAILARLYLNAEVYAGVPMYAQAEAAASYIIDNSSYKLADNSVSRPNPSKRPAVDSDPANLTGYATVFAANNCDNPEIIWSVEYNEVSAGGMNFHQMSLHYASQETYKFQDQPWNGYSALADFYNSYEDGDARKKANFLVGPQLDYNGNAIVDLASDSEDPAISYSVEINELEPNASRTGGVRLGKFGFKLFARPDLDNDYPIVRYADVLLMRAEAKARAAGDWSLAAPDVNALRARAGLGNLTVTADSFLAERGREMFMESTRRTDLIRFGKWGASWWEKSNSDAYRTVMPIPAQAIQNSNGTLTQNPGY
ncbi:MAG: RagB/SusD family nutrient uptake outer membrane protein [Flavobacteriaceae bacterium]|nr:RagB/SusD family nutrient uptake outer membrane protein [Flavobacteriaceae bacterium]